MAGIDVRPYPPPGGKKIRESGIPPLGFPKKFSLGFVHGCQLECKCRPTVSTCELLLKLPVQISSEEEMEAMMLSALGDSYGFGMI